jgi:hypothetical protein
VFIGIGLFLGYAGRPVAGNPPAPLLARFDSELITFDNDVRTFDQDADTTPNAFSFDDQTNAPLGTVIVSNTIAITGINTPTSVSITGGEYQIEDGEWTNAPGSITPDQALTVRHTSSSSVATATNTVVTVGGVSDTFTSTTVAADTTPDSFSFTAVTNAALSTDYASNTVTITGLNSPASVLVVGGTVSINGGAQVTSGTISNNQTLAARLTSSSSYDTLARATIDVGGISEFFDVTTGPAPSPTPTPTPSETIATPKAGAAEFTVNWAGSTSTTQTALNNAMLAAFNAMNAAPDPTAAPQKIAINTSNNIGSWFPTSRDYPSQLDIVAAAGQTPQFQRFGVGGSNIVFDGLGITYNPPATTSPVLVVNGGSNLTFSNMRFTLSQGIAIQVNGGTDHTFYRVGVNGGGGGTNNKMVLLQRSSAGVACVRPRFIECALQNGKGGDGFRIMGVQDGYFARNLVENLTKFSDSDHCDAMQITWDSLAVPNSLTCVDHLHWGSDGTHRFEGFQCTTNPTGVYNGAITVTRLKTIGGEVSGLSTFGTNGFTMEDVELYYIDYGVSGAQPPKIIVRNGLNVQIIGTCKAAGGWSQQTDSGWSTTTITRNDGITSGAEMTLTAAGRDSIVAAWKAANSGVPFV